MFHKHYFQFLLGITVILGEIDDSGYAKFWGVNKEHYGLCENGDKAGLLPPQGSDPEARTRGGTLMSPA